MYQKAPLRPSFFKPERVLFITLDVFSHCVVSKTLPTKLKTEAFISNLRPDFQDKRMEKQRQKRMKEKAAHPTLSVQCTALRLAER